MRKQAKIEFEKLKQSVGANAPKSGKRQRFSKRKGRPLVPMSYVEDLGQSSKGWKIRTNYLYPYWNMYLWHSDKGSLLHLLEFGTIHRAPQPWMRSTWDKSEEGILKKINKNIDTQLKKKGYRLRKWGI